MPDKGGMIHKTQAQSAFLAYAAILVYQTVMSVWAVNGSNVTEGGTFPLALFLVGRHMLASSALAGLACYKYGLASLIPESDDIKYIFIAGMFAQYMSPMFYLYGLQFVPATIGSIFDGPLIPVLVFVLAIVSRTEVLPESWSGRTGIVSGLCLTCGGVMFLIIASGSGGDTSTAIDSQFYLAVTSLFCEAFALSISILLQRPLAKKYRLLPFAFWISFSGLVASFLQVAFYEDGSIGLLGVLYQKLFNSNQLLFALLYNALLISVVNNLCLAYASEHLPSSIVAMGSCIQPVITLFLEVFFFAKPLNLSHGAALGAIAAGVHLFQKFNVQPSKCAEAPSTGHIRPAEMLHIA
eukprot:CAMPEP_0203782636 /NCGR_PEP_ID=MMETSP0099_2-20121227/11188_1 /ASSEMBLY_ACC=CAM_ASM_000209 /TAXON_ID=96639 /ORGANISM=" , Strain NY0313808BC1" /LENGTH=352 /DNA_ID=CAMNT_0050684329 /DNA_START=361 /DNA_END=1419 /DNA_ORIENTATION=-